MGKEVTLYNYLTLEESDELIGDLNGKKINAIMKAMFGEDAYCYHVIIDESDLELASLVAETFRDKLKFKRERMLYTCSRCHSKSSVVLDRKQFSWWRKFMTRGLTMIQCSKCSYVWYAQ